jgi:hypothetical protein
VEQLAEALRSKPEAAGSVHDGVIGILHSGRTMAMGRIGL